MRQEKYMGFSITWFPMEQQWMVFDQNHNIKSEFIDSLEESKRFIDKNLVK